MNRPEKLAEEMAARVRLGWRVVGLAPRTLREKGSREVRAYGGVGGVEANAHRARVCAWRARRLAAKCRQTERRQARAGKGAA